MITSLGIEWPLAEQPYPRSILGSRNWADYEVGCEVNLEEKGWAGIVARFEKVWNSGYWLVIDSGGAGD